VLYGLISVVVLTAVGGWRGIDWRTAFLHAGTGYVGMYLAEVTAIHFAGPGPTIAVIGSIPVVYAVIGARREGTPVADLLPSISLLALAIVLINAEAFAAGEESTAGIATGMIIAAVGVASWCLYALHNGDHLECNPGVTAAGWSSAVGVAAGALSIPLVVVGSFGGADGAGRLGAVVLFLAIGPSWVATMLWNRASMRIPRALAGQLIVFEPMSAFVLVHLLAGRAPSAIELAGELLLLVGAVVALSRLGGRREPEAHPGNFVGREEGDGVRHRRPGLVDEPDGGEFSARQVDDRRDHTVVDESRLLLVDQLDAVRDGS
jgi:drug/metabolite transporter (DMT)-like permease